MLSSLQFIKTSLNTTGATCSTGTLRKVTQVPTVELLLKCFNVSKKNTVIYRFSAANTSELGISSLGVKTQT